ncbi:MAG: DUF2220 domain-containing protein [Treponema sp.]|jgi:hypothetical protein|nr:DUF2220 domain-containing protein [Treponema sp.]
MTNWEKNITNAFISRFHFSSSATEAKRNSLRLRSSSIFPNFDSAHPEEQKAYLDAAKALEERNILRLRWEKPINGERISLLSCDDMEKLFEDAGKRNPGSEAEQIRELIKNKIPRLEKIRAHLVATGKEKQKPVSESGKILSFLNYLAVYFKAADARRGIDPLAANDFVRLMEAFLDPAQWGGISTRALSVLLFHDSKRLEYVLDFASPFMAQAEKQGVPVPDTSYLTRSFPETMIAGRLIFEYADGKQNRSLITNTGGFILGLPLSSVQDIKAIKSATGEESPRVLTIENKETFFTLGDPQNREYDCYLYTGGYPNRATAAVIRVLSASGFHFYHTGDLDIDGILILQTIQDIAQRPVSPLFMNTATFDRYLSCARPLSLDTFRQAVKIRDNTRTIPGMADLIGRIEETRRGVEQEIIDYRSIFARTAPSGA